MKAFYALLLMGVVGASGQCIQSSELKKSFSADDISYVTGAVGQDECDIERELYIGSFREEKDKVICVRREKKTGNKECWLAGMRKNS